MSRWLLRVVSATSQRVLPLTDAPVTVGRHQDNVLALPDDRASRHHCVIETRGATVWVKDLGSRNGTKLNGERIAEAQMRPGDVLALGGIRIELLQEAAPAEPAPPDDAGAPTTDEDAGTEQFHAVRRAPALGEEDFDPRRRRQRAQGPAEDPQAPLRQMIGRLGEQSWDESEIDLINCRGQRVHGGETDGSGGAGGGASRSGVTLLRLLLLLCFRARASDVHVEPKHQQYRVRLRVDGMMVEVARLEPALAARAIGVVKVLCDLDPATRNTIQEGRFSAGVEGRRVDYRVSFAPAQFGQNLVVRVLDSTIAPATVRGLAMPAPLEAALRRLVQQDAGVMVVCGPTGSGKTTTLYAVVRELDTAQRNVITIEDPPEFQIEGVTQIAVNERQGHSFSSLLRSVLRQDPDVLLVGEIRDAETARIAMQASMTGHLVLSTVHARDSIGTVFRLLDLGVEPYLVSSAVNLVLAQRLVRRLCDHCRLGRPATREQIARLGPAGEETRKLYYPAGCPRCLQTGYRGRLGVFELLTLTGEIRQAILKAPDAAELRRLAIAAGFTSLHDSAARLVSRGLTSLDEMNRVLGGE